PPPYSTQITAIWGSGPNDVWLTGNSGYTAHFDGTRWAAVLTGESEGLSGIAGSSASEVYAIGDSTGFVLRYDGKGWSRTDGPRLHWDGLFSITQVAGTYIAVGDDGVIQSWR
ncbi:MAG: WD40 repeat domain-containing protein, partial [Deltaproteobacteria bacterium]|nr:WD40 repeat domain-containing protein [Deltaproteobacteria bacterium]